MLSFKEILILIFVILGCLAIFLFSPNQPNPEKEAFNYPDYQNYQQSIPESLFKETEEMITEQKEYFSQSQLTRELNLSPSQEKIAPFQDLFYPDDSQSGSTANGNKLSLEDILAQTENLSSDLKLEFEEIYQAVSCPTCSGCGQRPDQDSRLEEYLVSQGYSDWSEYASSQNYQTAEEYFQNNQNRLLRESFSSYQTVYAQLGGGLCSCADPSCYVDTPHVRYYHCLGPCCCVCCVICCR